MGISKKKACRLTGRIFAVEIAIPEAGRPLEIPMCFASVDAPFLLGRQAFFDAFQIQFDKAALETKFSCVSQQSLGRQ